MWVLTLCGLNPSQVAERLITAWQTIRAQTRTQDAEQARDVIASTLRLHRVLPGQWLEQLLTRRIRHASRSGTANRVYCHIR
ncbi:hypothetical protein ABZ260_06135 [Streptosporangium sp. NPDC006013]|uniref:hypothetical protein n=1 Tax=Streptosporangium sp. NPDC006013 TaxID=3155596 RepID=UPI0033A50524